VTAPLVEARAVGRRFGGRTALHDVSLAAAPGEIVALAGPNGAGKSTLLALLAGALRPSSGTVSVMGTIGYVPQQPALWRRLTVRENLRLVARLTGCEGVDEVLAANALADIADRRVAELSIGQAQRANVAAGLLGEPDVLLLDEPTAALDPRQRRLVWELVAAVPARGGAVVFTTQNVEEVPLHADRLVALAGGAVAFEGSEADLRARVAGSDGERFEDVFTRFLDGGAP
jgi:ABC-type multidrug transport system ATPase subunit